jgi:hypothetical protein
MDKNNDYDYEFKSITGFKTFVINTETRGNTKYPAYLEYEYPAYPSGNGISLDEYVDFSL